MYLRRSARPRRGKVIVTTPVTPPTGVALSTAALWLRPDPANLTIATGISGWTDVGAAPANNFAQATGANQPAANASVAALNNNPTAQNAGSKFMTNADTITTVDWSMYLVWRCTSNVTIAQYAWSCSDLWGVVTAGTDATIQQRPGFFDGTTLLRVPNAVITNTTYIMSVIKSGTSYAVRVNGGTNSVSGTLTARQIASPKIFQRNTGTVLELLGHMADLLVFSSSHDSTSRDSVESQLATRYGVTLV